MGKKEVWNFFSKKKKKIGNEWYYAETAFIDKERAEDIANQLRSYLVIANVLPVERRRSKEIWWAPYIPVAQNPYYRGLSASQRLKKGPQFTRKQSLCCCSICVIIILISVIMAIFNKFI